MDDALVTFDTRVRAETLTVSFAAGKAGPAGDDESDDEPVFPADPDDPESLTGWTTTATSTTSRRALARTCTRPCRLRARDQSVCVYRPPP